MSRRTGGDTFRGRGKEGEARSTGETVGGS